MSTKLFSWCVKRHLFSRRHNILVRPVANKFWESDHKGGYQTGRKLNPFEKMKILYDDFTPETEKFKEEMQHKFYGEPFLAQVHGDYEIPWKFNSTEAVDEWTVTADSDHNEGYSRAFFELGKNKTGIFHGYLDCKVPKDGKTAYAGYANINSPERVKSYARTIPYDWSHYNTLMLRFRGDGRPYFIVIQMDRYFDAQWFDQYNYPLYTKGGPYWQEEFIPLNKFFMAAKGRIQTKQSNLIGQLDSVKFLGITLADGVTGSFQLEIDYVGLYYDQSLNEEFAYEMYETERYKAND